MLVLIDRLHGRAHALERWGLAHAVQKPVERQSENADELLHRLRLGILSAPRLDSVRVSGCQVREFIETSC